MSWLDGTVLVTGATGFIGGRICERLVQAGARRVRALVHSMHRAARIARLPIELCPGNLLETDSLRQALADSTVVIHCGLGNARGIVRGTENLLSVCREGKVKRFVHMSTAAVYGLTPPPGSEVEDAPLRLTGDGYCDNKWRAERAVLRAGQRGLPVVILRPSIVYGPYSAWSTRLIADLREHRVALIDQGKGACNIAAIRSPWHHDARSQKRLWTGHPERIGHTLPAERAPPGAANRHSLHSSRRPRCTPGI